MNLQNLYRQVPECLLEDMGDDALLFNPGNATTLHLNGPSRIVWGLCNGKNSAVEMITALQETFPDQAEQIEADVIAVLKELIENDVIEKVNS